MNTKQLPFWVGVFVLPVSALYLLLLLAIAASAVALNAAKHPAFVWCVGISVLIAANAAAWIFCR